MLVEYKHWLNWICCWTEDAVLVIKGSFPYDLLGAALLDISGACRVNSWNPVDPGTTVENYSNQHFLISMEWNLRNPAPIMTNIAVLSASIHCHEKIQSLNPNCVLPQTCNCEDPDALLPPLYTYIQMSRASQE